MEVVTRFRQGQWSRCHNAERISQCLPNTSPGCRNEAIPGHEGSRVRISEVQGQAVQPMQGPGLKGGARAEGAGEGSRRAFTQLLITSQGPALMAQEVKPLKGFGLWSKRAAADDTRVKDPSRAQRICAPTCATPTCCRHCWPAVIPGRPEHTATFGTAGIHPGHLSLSSCSVNRFFRKGRALTTQLLLLSAGNR